MLGEKQNKKKASDIILGIITVAVAVLTIMVVIAFGYRWFQEKFYAGQGTEEDADEASMDEDTDVSYVSEVKYIGGIGYPEVYEQPFGTDDLYVTNKQLWQDNPDMIPLALDSAKTFMDKLINSGYREIYENQDMFVQNMLSYMDTDWNYDEDSQGGQTAEEYLNSYAEYMIDNQVSIEGEFISDTSLVYEDGLIYVRGMVEYEVFSSSDPNLEADGEKKVCMMEVALHQASDESSGENDDGTNLKEYRIVSFSELEY